MPDPDFLHPPVFARPTAFQRFLKRQNRVKIGQIRGQKLIGDDENEPSVKFFAPHF